MYHDCARQTHISNSFCRGKSKECKALWVRTGVGLFPLPPSCGQTRCRRGSLYVSMCSHHISISRVNIDFLLLTTVTMATKCAIHPYCTLALQAWGKWAQEGRQHTGQFINKGGSCWRKKTRRDAVGFKTRKETKRDWGGGDSFLLSPRADLHKQTGWERW